MAVRDCSAVYLFESVPSHTVCLHAGLDRQPETVPE